MALFTDRRMGGGASMAMRSGMSVANPNAVDPRNFAAGRKTGMRTRQKNDRMTGTVMDVQAGQATVYKPQAYGMTGGMSPVPSVVQQMGGGTGRPGTSPWGQFAATAQASRTVLPQGVGRVGGFAGRFR